MFIREIISEGDVTQLKPQTSGTKYPLFSKQNIQKAYNEWYNGAAVDTDIEIVGNDNQQYYILQNNDSDSQHFNDGDWYLTDADYEPVDLVGYESPEDLLFSHSAEGYEPKDPDDMDENLRAWFGKGKKGGAGGGGWDRYNTKGERIGKCGDSKKGEGKPKCLSKSKAASLRAKGGKAAIGKAVSKKRRNDPNKNRKGKAKNVSNTVGKKK